MRPCLDVADPPRLPVLAQDGDLVGLAGSLGGGALGHREHDGHGDDAEYGGPAEREVQAAPRTYGWERVGVGV